MSERVDGGSIQAIGHMSKKENTYQYTALPVLGVTFDSNALFLGTNAYINIVHVVVELLEICHVLRRQRSAAEIRRLGRTRVMALVDTTRVDCASGG
jgi:hypothetical protein